MTPMNTRRGFLRSLLAAAAALVAAPKALLAFNKRDAQGDDRHRSPREIKAGTLVGFRGTTQGREWTDPSTGYRYVYVEYDSIEAFGGPS